MDFDAIIECSVCLERLKHDARVLPCQHTFCLDCLRVSWAEEMPQTWFTMIFLLFLGILFIASCKQKSELSACLPRMPTTDQRLRNRLAPEERIPHSFTGSNQTKRTSNGNFHTHSNNNINKIKWTRKEAINNSNWSPAASLTSSLRKSSLWFLNESTRRRRVLKVSKGNDHSSYSKSRPKLGWRKARWHRWNLPAIIRESESRCKCLNAKLCH